MVAVAYAYAPARPTDPIEVKVTGLLVGQEVVLMRNLGSTQERKAGTVAADSTGTANRDDWTYPLGAESLTYSVYTTDMTEFLAVSNVVKSPDSVKPIIRDLLLPEVLTADVIIVDITNRVRGARVATHRVVAQRFPVTSGDLRQASEGTLQLYCRTHVERDQTIGTMSTGSPCVLRVPSACRGVVDDMYFTPLDITEQRHGTNGANILTVDFVEVGEPDLPPFTAISYEVQTANADDLSMTYAILTANFVGERYLEMYLSPTGVAP